MSAPRLHTSRNAPRFFSPGKTQEQSAETARKDICDKIIEVATIEKNLHAEIEKAPTTRCGKNSIW